MSPFHKGKCEYFLCKSEFVSISQVFLLNVILFYFFVAGFLHPGPDVKKTKRLISNL